MLPTSRDDLDNNLNPLKNIGKSIVYYLINQILLQENFFFNIVTAHTSLIVTTQHPLPENVRSQR